MEVEYTNNGFWADWKQFKQMLSNINISHEELLKKLTVEIEVEYTNRKEYVKIYQFGDGARKWQILLPRSVIKPLHKAGYVRVKNTQNLAMSPRVEFKLTLIENQPLIVEYLMSNVYTSENIKNGLAGATLSLQAGKGKTFVAAALIARLKMRALFITLNKPLAQQAILDFGKALGDSVRVDKITTATTKKPDVGVVIINTALKQTKEFYDYYSFIIIDEIHTMCSEQRREIYWMIQRSCLLGLSATTGERKDGLDVFYEKTIGSIIHADKIEGYKTDDQAFKGEVKVINYYGPDELTQNLKHPSTGNFFVPWIVAQFFNDDTRNKLILDELRELLAQDHYIYIFCEELEPLAKLRKLIEENLKECVSTPELGTFVGGIDDTKINNIKKESRVILTTYRYSGCGVSIQRMTAIIFASPRKAQMKQIVGRILRKGSDHRILRRIVDIVDNRTILKHQFKHRCVAYDYYGFTRVYRKHFDRNSKLVDEIDAETEYDDELDSLACEAGETGELE